MCILPYRTSPVIILFIKITSMNHSQEDQLPNQNQNLHPRLSSFIDVLSQRLSPSVQSDLIPEKEGTLIKHLMESNAKARQFRHGHSLKGIAHAIKFLLESQGELKLKDLSCLLFELVCQTEMGMAIANGYLVPPSDLQNLRSKYANESICQPATIIRNVKRRFYDVLNVMIASQTLTKHKNLVRLTELPSVPSHRYGCSPKEILQQLQSEMSEKQTNLKKEKKRLRQSAIEFLAVSYMMERNLKQQEKVEHLNFPLIIAISEPKSKTVIDLAENSVQISSKKQMTIIGEKTVIPELFKPTKKEIKQFLNGQ